MNSVLLINREMTIVHAPCLVQGITGEKVGVSKFSPKHSCHILELTPEAYEKNAKALMQACHIALRRWEPHFVFEEVPEKVREFWDGYNAGMDGKSVFVEASFEWKMGRSVSSGAVSLDLSDAALKAADEYASGVPIYGMQTPEPSTLLGSQEETAKFMAGVSYSEETIPAENIRGFLRDAFPIDRKTSDALTQAVNEAIESIRPTITERTKYWSLIKAAKDEGVDLSKCKTNAERAKAINEKRCQPH